MRKIKDSGIEWIGEIPEDWKVQKLKYLGRLTSNGVDKKIKEGQKLFKSVHYMDVYRNSLKELQNSDDYLVISADDDKRSSCQLNKGDVLFTNSSETPDDIGHSTVIKEDLENILFGYHLMRFRPGCRMELHYEKYLFGSYYIRKWFEYRAIGMTRYGLSRADFEEILIVLPSLAEQTQIGIVLDRKCTKIDETIEMEKQVIEKLKAYKQSVITEAVTKGLDPNVPMKDSGIEWIGEIPEHWCETRIKYVLKLNPSYSEKIDGKAEVSFAPMETLTNYKFEPKTALLDSIKGSYTYFANEDIIMAKVTPCFENGNIAIADNLKNGVGFGSSELFVFRCKLVSNRYMLYYFQNEIFRQNCIATMYGTGGLKRVSSNYIYNYKLVIPELSAQIQIANYLDAKCAKIDQAITQKQTLIEKLTQYKKSLIYECVTGKREVHHVR
ncbi:hypothetical protein GH810_12935 [Acetobacterium paludosum]|uniref:Type I restriction modification DNA specificity domain-containing protein n=1 Tax=Acetobacterium paludosum TaxID=52693 RepID=A0A923KQJ8_9FIRM|nr:restriction endonuclease subunit S [Acetobacterium paludosum]MBC3889219.1 hypothetical protein [Acetobacterium paludosum]